VTDIFTALVSGFLAWQAFRFVKDALAYEEIAFGSVPLWVTASVLPLAFTLLSMRYLLLTGFHLGKSFGAKEDG
jgi:TRAP-type C4-dicarboxylate transport system permease small subunit